MRECFCFGSEAVNASGEAVRRLVKSRVEFLRSRRDFVRECFCFGSEAVNASGEAVRRLVKSRVEFAASPLANYSRASPERNIAALPPLARSRIPPATQASNLWPCPTTFRF